MADLILEWGALGAFGTNLSDTDALGGAPSATVDTGGVAVDIRFDGLSPSAQAFTFNAPAYVAEGETFNAQSHLKLFGDGGLAAGETSTVELDFRATDTAMFTDNVQNVAFRLNEIDADVFGDSDNDPGAFEDIVSITAFDADGNEVPVVLTPEGNTSVTGQTVDGNVPVTPENFNGSVLVEIAGPVSRIFVEYANGDVNDQRALISDVEFSTVDVGDGNLPPDAVDDDISTDIGTPVTFNPAANDTDPDGDLVVCTGFMPPAIGTATLNGDGTVTYTPPADFEGTVTFDYTADDGNGGTDTGTITVTVGDPDGNQPPVAVDDTATTGPATPITVVPLSNDSDPDGDPLTVDSIGAPTNGIATLNGDGTVTYTPNAGFLGDDTISYTISDDEGGTDTGEIVVTVSQDGGPGGNLPPDAVDDQITTDQGEPVTFDPRINDSDPDDDPLQVTAVSPGDFGTTVLNPDGTITYTPDPDFEGVDTILYRISDGRGGEDEAEIFVTITAPDVARIDTDIFPVDPTLQPLDPLDGADQDPDPLDDLDNVTGTGGADLIETGDDDDTINAGAGNDTVLPGIDDDLVDLGGGNDSLFDIQGSDTISGGQGNDTIIAGTDTFSDYENDDPSFAPGSPLRDTFGFTSDPNQEDGRDLVSGNGGDDFIETGDDRDTVSGGQGNDTIDGGIDDDVLRGNQGDDVIFGGHGSDTLDGGQGNDLLDGSNLAALEIVDADDPQTENDRDLIQGFLGDDTLIGGDDDDTLQGGSGNDLLDGGIDDDLLFGGRDDDTLLGGQGNDTLNGGAGVDDIQGGADRDVIIVDSARDGTGDTVDGGSGGFVDQANPEDPPNQDYDILDLSGVGEENVDWRLTNVTDDSNGNGIDGTVEFLNGRGDVTGTMDFFEIEEVIPCFTPGTLIATPKGERMVEELEVGDRVITRDNGIQEIKWVGRKDLTGHELARKPHLNPVLIRQGALGNNLPEHDMLVSPNHRVLVANDKTALYFEEREVLVAAKHLVGLEGVDVCEANGVAYLHIMFENHEVVLSNGAWTESFQPGDYSLKGIGNAQREEILELFPELSEEEGLRAYASARRSLKKHEAALLTQ